METRNQKELIQLPIELGSGIGQWPFTRLAKSLDKLLLENHFGLLRRVIEIDDSQAIKDVVLLNRYYLRGNERAGSCRILHLPVYHGIWMEKYGPNSLGDEYWDFEPNEVTWSPLSNEEAKPLIPTQIILKALRDGRRGHEEIFYHGKDFHAFLDVDTDRDGYSARAGAWLKKEIADKEKFLSLLKLGATKIDVDTNTENSLGDMPGSVYYQTEIFGLNLRKVLTTFENIIHA